MKRLFFFALTTIVAIILVPIITFIALYCSADMMEPQITIHPAEYVTESRGDTLICNDSYLRYDSCGIWELSVVGSNQVRGAKQGALTKELMKYQEDVFIDQIREIIPSDSYLGMLRKFIIIFNRNIAEHIPLEYREEIAAMSQFCTHDYDAIGSPYERQLNYHAAHDIGHTMQQYMLVGCSSFGAWGERTESGELIIGRNFDFYVGDDFARNMLITFASPDEGYRYASIGWAGMIGVLSGMNEKGLTVTINAAKGAIPTSATTPISILTREILQYASNIDEAYEIAMRRKTFVSESILIGSANDSRAAIIEKSPDKIALFEVEDDVILCTNHYQSKLFIDDEYNIENILNSDSKYRFDRLNELLNRERVVDYNIAAKILRDNKGLGDRGIGIGNEMTLNQSIVHHAVIFEPSAQRMWVSTAPWQSGAIVSYNLANFFNGDGSPMRVSELDIAADSLFLKGDYIRLMEYRSVARRVKGAINNKLKLDSGVISHFVELNPDYYNTYQLVGDYYLSLDMREQAATYYKKMLTCEIPYREVRADIETKIKRLEE